MLERNSFMPYVAVACAAGGGAYFGMAHDWGLGILSVMSAVLLLLAAAVAVVVIGCIVFEKISGEFILIPCGLTFIGLIVHAADITMIKGQYSLRVEILMVIFFAVMILIIAACAFWKRFNFKTTFALCLLICSVVFISCFAPLLLGDDFAVFLDEMLRSTLPIVFYFLTYFFYFIGMERSKFIKENNRGDV